MKWQELWAQVEALPNIVEKNQNERNTESPRTIEGEEKVMIEIFTLGIGWHLVEVDKLFYDVKSDTVVIRSLPANNANRKTNEST